MVVTVDDLRTWDYLLRVSSCRPIIAKPKAIEWFATSSALWVRSLTRYCSAHGRSTFHTRIKVSTYQYLLSGVR